MRSSVDTDLFVVFHAKPQLVKRNMEPDSLTITMKTSYENKRLTARSVSPAWLFLMLRCVFTACLFRNEGINKVQTKIARIYKTTASAVGCQNNTKMLNTKMYFDPFLIH